MPESPPSQGGIGWVLTLMAKVSDKYLAVVDKFIYNGLSIKHVAMTEEQKLRTMIVYEVYQLWMTDKQINPMEMCRKVSSRIYGDMLLRAEGDAHYAALCERLGIRAGVPRGYDQLANDVYTFDYLVGRFSDPTRNVERAKVVDASDWLIREGMKSGNDRAVKNGADLKMRLFKDFDERQQGFENMANTDINITADVSVVKPDRTNYTEEQKREFAKRFGLPEKEVDDLIRNSDGVYETAPIEVERERDIFLNE